MYIISTEENFKILSALTSHQCVLLNASTPTLFCSGSLTAGTNWVVTFCAFQIRDHPLYHLIKAQAKKKEGKLADAIQTLQMAMSLPGVRRAGSSSKSKNKKIELGPADCVSVFLELAEALWLNGEQVK